MAIDLNLKCKVEGCAKVYYCKGYGKYDDPENIVISGTSKSGGSNHPECKERRDREYHLRKKLERDGRAPTFRNILEMDKE